MTTEPRADREMHRRTVRLEPGDALLMADVQNDFLPGGALGIAGGDEIIPILLRYLARFQARGLPTFATRDWHPPDHCSFREQGGIWPAHCVAGSSGSEPAPTFQLASSVMVIYKATDPRQEAYSAFQGTPLHHHLRVAGTRRLFVGGLATDYCVLNTVKDALGFGYSAVLLLDAIRAANVNPGDGPAAEREMIRLGAVGIRYDALVD